MGVRAGQSVVVAAGADFDGVGREVFAVDAKAVVLATGAYDRVLPFPGWDLPGVYSAGAAQALAKGQRVAVGKRVLVAGTGPFLLPAGVAGRGRREGCRTARGELAEDRPQGLGRGSVGCFRQSSGGSRVRRSAREAPDSAQARWTVIAAHGEELSRPSPSHASTRPGVRSGIRAPRRGRRCLPGLRVHGPTGAGGVGPMRADHRTGRWPGCCRRCEPADHHPRCVRGR